MRQVQSMGWGTSRIQALLWSRQSSLASAWSWRRFRRPLTNELSNVAKGHAWHTLKRLSTSRDLRIHPSNMASPRRDERAFKLDINITRLKDSSPVFFKIDGERFKETQTLKLQVDTTYRISFEFRPSMEVRWAVGWKATLSKNCYVNPK